MTPLVSVAMIAYNHRPFIAQAIDSVLSQQCEFPIEIVISDDCSPDGTASVIDGYHQTNIVRVDPTVNVGMHANFARVWTACRGKYIALLEGDDWWHEPLKLAREVEVIEAHPKMVVCGHAIRCCNVAGDIEGEWPFDAADIPSVTPVDRLIEHGNYIPTCSSLYRRGVVETLPPWIARLGFVDYPLLLLHGMKGDIGFLREPMASYRQHTGGIWSSTNPVHRERQYVQTMTEVLKLPGLTPQQKSLAAQRMEISLNELRDAAYWCRKRGEHRQALRLHRELLRHRVRLRDTTQALKTLAAAALGRR